jgi:hypothetical protein
MTSRSFTTDEILSTGGESDDTLNRVKRMERGCFLQPYIDK